MTKPLTNEEIQKLSFKTAYQEVVQEVIDPETNEPMGLEAGYQQLKAVCANTSDKVPVNIKFHKGYEYLAKESALSVMGAISARAASYVQVMYMARDGNADELFIKDAHYRTVMVRLDVDVRLRMPEDADVGDLEHLLKCAVEAQADSRITVLETEIYRVSH